MKVVAIIQARMGSERLPNKVMVDLGGMPMIEFLLSRLSRAEEIDEIVVATSINPINQALCDHVKGLGYRCYQGSEEDVLDRYFKAAKISDADIVVRITGDCPLIDPQLVDETILSFKESGADYLSNSYPPTYPDGLDTEVFTFAALEKAALETTDPYHREHVTPYLRESGKFTVDAKQSAQDNSNCRWTVDEPCDLEVITNVVGHFTPNIHFSWRDVLELEKKQPDLFKANKELMRNQGALLGKGQKLWKRAKHIIPGGNMLLSKRSEMFLPEYWPSYFNKAKGCKVTDLDGNEFFDMLYMSVGTNILGYGNEEVDDAVRDVVSNGNLSTLNCPEEVYLAEKLIELHPWADMVRLARTGGEANSIAIRIARAATGREKVAICGYHGWHDWYLAANLANDDSLEGHLLPGLEPNGVPQDLSGSVLPFTYNNFTELEGLVRDHDIGVIKMEVSRNMSPEDGFLENVRKLATDNNIVLIFDECTSGFRQSFGGLHKLYNVEPDMAVFGKALGNGYAITAVIGKRDFMEAAQTSFISSSFWTERIGPAAALKTLEVMEREKSWEIITKIGQSVGERWQKLAEKYELPIQISGLPAMVSFAFPSPDMLKYKTLITQEMLKKNFFAGTSFYACTEHTQPIIDQYFEELEPIFALIKDCETGLDIDNLLDGPVCHSGFKRLN